MTCCDGAHCRLLAGDHRHGTSSAYANFGCRCPACRQASAGKARELRARNAAAGGRVVIPRPRAH